MTVNPKVFVLAGVFALGVSVGAGVVRYAWQCAELASAREATARAEANVKKLKELQDEKDAALSERDNALDRARIVDADNQRLSERLRQSARAAMSNSTSSACRRHLAECRELLAEGASLATEGGEMVGKLAADRAAVRRLTK